MDKFKIGDKVIDLAFGRVGVYIGNDDLKEKILLKLLDGSIFYSKESECELYDNVITLSKMRDIIEEDK